MKQTHLERDLELKAAAHVDDLLDDALKGTFPASDPVAIAIETTAEANLRKGARWSEPSLS